MRVILFGATGMVGQGALRECVLDAGVSEVLAPVRRAGALPVCIGDLDIAASGKVHELVLPDFYDYAAAGREFAGYDACFFCLGVSSAGMKETDYRRVTYDLTMAAAQALLQANPTGMTMIYVSGASTNAEGRMMWMRVKGATENALLVMGFKDAYMFRPGGIVPLHGVRSKTALYQAVYSGLRPLLPLLLRMFPRQLTTTEQVGRAMLAVARNGYPRRVLEPADIVDAEQAAA